MKKLVMIGVLSINLYSLISALHEHPSNSDFIQQMNIIKEFRQAVQYAKQPKEQPKLRRSKRLADKKLAKDSKKDQN